MNFRPTALLLHALILMAAPLSGHALEMPKSVGLQEHQCWFTPGKDWPETSCYFMSVHEVHDDPASKLIKFPVIRFKGGDSNKTPVLHLGGGGPGSPMGLKGKEIDELVWSNYFSLFMDYDRDLIVMDPRGVGMAEPRMFCDEGADLVRSIWARDLNYQQEVEIYSPALKSCRDRLIRSGHDLTAYNSAAVARDVELLRNELGVESLFLYGVSYGSRYALTIAREFPATVQAMVLDGPVFPDIRTTDQLVRNYALAIKRAVALCTDNTACVETFPNLEQRFWDLVASLDQRPAQMQISDPITFEPIHITLNGDRFFDVVFSAAYDEAFHEELPGIIKSMEFGGTDLIAPYIRYYLFDELDLEYAGAAGAMHYCYEEFPFEAPISSRKYAKQNAFLVERQEDDYAQSKLMCGLWNPKGAVDRREGLAIETDVPTLIFSGELDPVIPIEDIDQQTDNFGNLVYYSFTDIAHDVVSADGCAERLAGAFYEFGLDYADHESCMEDEEAIILRFKTQK